MRGVEGNVGRDRELRRVQADAARFGAGDGIAAAVIVTVELCSGMRSPGGGAADTLYCALPAPVMPLIDQFRLALPLLLTVKVFGVGAVPPQLAEKARDVGATEGPPPMLAPESGSGDGRAAQSVPVAVMVMAPCVARRGGREGGRRRSGFRHRESKSWRSKWRMVRARSPAHPRRASRWPPRCRSSSR